jgi:hypothetical protein
LVELVGRAAQVLADADVRAPNGRVTELPDARTIRWYATIGLVDKPGGFRGRTALYGHRHLLQIVAVKRMQARGMALAEIQAQLAGATEATLRRIADLPEDGAGPAASIVDTAAPMDTVDTVHSLDSAVPSDTVDGAGGQQPRPRFWADRPVAGPTAPTPPTAPTAPTAPAPALSGTLHGVSLPGGVVLLVPTSVPPGQVAAIRHAARPLLEYLSTHGLLNPDEGAHA